MNKLIVANLKMNHSLEDMKIYKDTLSQHIDNLIVCPSYIYLDLMKSDNYILGSQDGFYEDKGSYTGEVSFYQLKEMGVEYSIIGHSGRRYKLNESNETINKKLISCINNKIKPILCIGETKEQKELNETFNVIKFQLNEALKNVEIRELIVAYEPVWSIGSGNIPTNEEILEVHKYIKELLTSEYNVTPIVLYGGSVNKDNIKEISNIDGVDGMIIGTACVNPNDLLDALREIKM
jgi:triosephosphate isomerase